MSRTTLGGLLNHKLLCCRICKDFFFFKLPEYRMKSQEDWNAAQIWLQFLTFFWHSWSDFLSCYLLIEFSRRISAGGPQGEVGITGLFWITWSSEPVFPSKSVPLCHLAHRRIMSQPDLLALQHHVHPSSVGIRMGFEKGHKAHIRYQVCYLEELEAADIAAL